MTEDIQKNEPSSPNNPTEPINTSSYKKNVALILIIAGIIVIGVGSFATLQKNGGLIKTENLPELPKTAMNTDPVPQAKTDLTSYKNTPFTKADSITPSGKEKIYSYIITEENGTLSPREIIIPKNQLSQLVFTSRNNDIDLVFPKELGILKTFVKQNEESPVVINTQQVGVFPFNCQKKCPQNKTTEGVVVIK